jgi:hypothetical protein
MMMRMLEAGGVAVLIDNARQADDDNPEGYYEFERVKGLAKGDCDWLAECDGKAIKVVSALLEHLPNIHQYQVILMIRHMKEILASQKRMLTRHRQPADGISDAEMARLFDKHIQRTREWLLSHTNVSMLELSYNELMEDPCPSVQRVNQFLGGSLDVNRMVGVVNTALYRNRTF